MDCDGVATAINAVETVDSGRLVTRLCDDLIIVFVNWMVGLAGARRPFWIS